MNENTTHKCNPDAVSYMSYINGKHDVVRTYKYHQDSEHDYENVFCFFYIETLVGYTKYLDPYAVGYHFKNKYKKKYPYHALMNLLIF